MVLRPYQYYATEAIIDRVKTSVKNGYIWHTTGSGKTLTSFKTSQVLMKLPQVHKVVFVVDRKDLDYQTAKEFNSFSKGSVDSTDNTSILVNQLADDTKLIVTTIQKLNTAISKQKHLGKIDHLKNEKVVFIFDECHRSQFGETHKKIKSFFGNSQMFGFTGTPIFAENAIKNEKGKRTTKDLFDECLHKYVITDAIRDENVLKFSVEYVGKFKRKEASQNDIDIDVEDIDRKEIMESPQRLTKISEYILATHDRKTHSRDYTAMFCVSSVDVLTKYYEIFKDLKDKGKHNLKIATIFSYVANEDDKDANGFIPDELDIPEGQLNANSHTRDKLESYIQEYNKAFSTKYTTKNSESFYNYYKDIGKRVKNKEIDILLVVNMFLTGFDSKLLNTLYVDKNLQFHGLIQAYSRTNRILNETKSQGNIVCFRNLKQATDDALALFANPAAKEVIFLQPYEVYVNKFNKAAGELRKNAAELTGSDPSQCVGTMLMLRVMPGDQFSVAAQTYYNAQQQTSQQTQSSQAIASSLLSALTGGTADGVPVSDLPQNQQVLYNTFNNPSFAPTYDLLTGEDFDSTAPAAFVSYMVLDQNFNVIPDQSGALQMASPAGVWNAVSTSDYITIGQPGYLLLFSSARSYNPVYFDNVDLTFYSGTEIEEDHYYPYGLTLTNPDPPIDPTQANSHRYNGIELNKDLGLETYEAYYRDLDPQIGRWKQIDPKPNAWISPYASMSDNPVLKADPLGDIDRPQNAAERFWNSISNQEYINTAYTQFLKMQSSGQRVFYTVHGDEAIITQQVGDMTRYGHNEYVTHYTLKSTFVTAQGGPEFVGNFEKENFGGVKLIWSAPHLTTGIVTDYFGVSDEGIFSASSNLWKVGIYSDLRGTEIGLDAHHVGQQALMDKFIEGYNAETAPSILVPRAGHTILGPNGIVSRSTKNISNARQLLARDIFELRRVYPGIPNSALEKLIEMNKIQFSKALKK